VTPTSVLTASDDHGLGQSVALDAAGDTAAVADGGGYRIYVRQAATWTATVTPTAALSSGAASSSSAGNAVALSQDGTTVFGLSTDIAGGSYGGRIFARSAGGWSSMTAPTARLTAPIPDQDARFGDDRGVFGQRVALSATGAEALVGEGNMTGWSVGVAGVFERTGAGWSARASPTATLAASTQMAPTYFGEAAALSHDGSTALVGASGTADGRGGAYIFTRSPRGWYRGLLPSAVLSDERVQGQGFAVALSASGSVALVSPAQAGLASATVLIFVRDGPRWTSTQVATAMLNASSLASASGCCLQAALSGDGRTVLLATSTAAQRPAVYVFTESPGGWQSGDTPVAILSAPGTTPADFGAAIALSDDGQLALIGGGGHVYVYAAEHGSWRGASQPAAILADPASATDSMFGASLALSGDGSTAVVGDQTLHQGLGAVFLFRRGIQGWRPSGSLFEQAADRALDFGASVTVNGNGTAVVATEVAVQAPHAERALALRLDHSGIVAAAVLAGGAGVILPAVLSGDGTTVILGDDLLNNYEGSAIIYTVP
jgi:hypothetical protein